MYRHIYYRYKEDNSRWRRAEVCGDTKEINGITVPILDDKVKLFYFRRLNVKIY